jgi:hypothetical protein
MGLITHEPGTKRLAVSFQPSALSRVLPATGGVAPSVVPITRIASGENRVHRQVLALKRTGFQAGGEFHLLGVACRDQLQVFAADGYAECSSAITVLTVFSVPNLALHCHAPGSGSFCLAAVQVSVGLRLFRIVQVDWRIQGGREGEALGQKNAGRSGLEFVAGGHVWL